MHRRHSETVNLGVSASVIFDREDHGPTVLPEACGRGLRNLEDAIDYGDMVPPVLVEEIDIVSIYTLHVALYALQNPTPENIKRALYKIGTSGDVNDHADPDTLHPMPVPKPPGWDDWVPGDEDASEGTHGTQT